jgi:hypothetical protein
MSFKMESVDNSNLKIQVLEVAKVALVVPDDKVHHLSQEFFAALAAEDSAPISPPLRLKVHPEMEDMRRELAKKETTSGVP